MEKTKSSFDIYLHSIKLGIQSRGLINTIKMIVIALIDQLEDKFRGIEAHDFVDSAKSISHKKSSVYANFYQPVRSIPFRTLLKKLNLEKNGNFVDIGAGTGKAMILALDYGFQKVKGIEIVDDLVNIAHKNQHKHGIKDDNFSMVSEDALSYQFEADDKIFFFNDPFSNEVFEPFLNNLENFWSREDKLVLIYKNNSLRKIESYENLARKYESKTFDIWGNYFQVIIMVPGDLR